MVIVIVILMISGIETIGYKYKNSKIPTDDRADGPIEILYYHSEHLTPLPAATCAAHNYRPRKWSLKSDADDQTERRRDIETDGQRHRHIRSTRPHCGRPDPSVRIKYYCGGYFGNRGLQPRVLRAITGHANVRQKSTRTIRRTERQTHR